MNGKFFNSIRNWTSLVRDIGVIIGVPTLIMAGSWMYERQLEILRERIEFSKNLQYDEAYVMISSQKKLFEMERESLKKEIDKLKASDPDGVTGDPNGVKSLELRVRALDETIQVLGASTPSFMPLAPAGLTQEQQNFAKRHLRIGKPQTIYERIREGYVVGNDSRLKIPIWVQYELSQGDLVGTAERSDDFRPDASIPFTSRAGLKDYTGSGYDFGHMVPASDMKRNEKVMSESFLLSTIAPQVGVGFNRNIWRRLEAAIRGWVQERGRLTIITGPIFAIEKGKVSYHVIGENNVAVPTHFYKIIVDNNDLSNVQALAFMMPNEDLSGKDYRDYLTTIDSIEKATGIDFLSALPVTVQHIVESNLPGSIW